MAVRNEQIPFRLPVDRVFSKDGFGTVVTGTMIEGNLSVGDPVELMPSGQRAKVRTLRSTTTRWSRLTPGSGWR